MKYENAEIAITATILAEKLVKKAEKTGDLVCYKRGETYCLLSFEQTKEVIYKFLSKILIEDGEK
jgi:hypothetical protein